VVEVAQGEKLACFSIDVEPDLGCAGGDIRLFEDESKMTRLVRLFQAENIPLTCFTVMESALRYRRQLAELSKTLDAEFAVHSFSHDTQNPTSKDELARSWEAFGEIWNAAPLGYRAPVGRIDERGLERVAEQGYAYDSSVIPTIRPDGYGYNNTRFGRTPFQYQCTGGGSLLELPIACLAGSRMPFVLSWVKLAGLRSYEAALGFFPLPNSVVTYFHPYDLYIKEVVHNIPGWKRHAHLRNAEIAWDILSGMIRILRERGYCFILMRDLARVSSADPQLRRYGAPKTGVPDLTR
jgi:hypothetical protein